MAHIEISVDHNSTIPLHLQLLNQLRHLILSGQWAPGNRIPSESELQNQLNISRSTIRQALRNAEADGLIERVPGKGTFVANAAPTNEQRLIGYITMDLSSSDLQYRLLSGFESEARDKGYRIIFSNSRNDILEENRLLDELLNDKVSGIFIWPIQNSDPSRRLRQLIDQAAVPIMLMDRPLPATGCDCVTSANFQGAYNAVKYLISLGHQKVIFLSHPVLEILPVAERLRGYQAALTEAGLRPADPKLIGPEREIGTRQALTAYSNSTGPEIEAIQQFLQEPDPPTAIFAVNDVVALLVLRAAAQAGRHIPDDLSLVGFDDIELVAHVDVPLTTVAQDSFGLGKRGAKLLIERIEGYHGPPRQEILPTQLKIRASTGQPATTPIIQPVSESVSR
jgi:GntR family transcriptional regulator of arabinose operon